MVLVGLDLVPSSGGAVKTQGLFARALEARVVGFTAAAKLAAEGTAVPGAVQVPVGDGLAGRLYSWAPAAARAEAEALVAGAGLLSCHILYRAHVHFVARAARRGRIPYWVVPHGCLDPWVFTYRAWLKRPWMALVGRRFLGGAAAVLCATRREAEKAAPWLPAGRTRVIPWPVEVLDLTAREADRAAARAEIGAAADARVLLYLGRLHPMKRPMETVVAFAQGMRAAKAETDAHLVLIGPEEGVTRRQVAGTAALHGVAGRVHALGGRFGMERDRWLRAADGFVSLSHRENFGHTVAEALGAEVPVILGPGHDLAPEVAPLEAGWILGSDEPGQAAAAIAQWLAASPDTLRGMGARGRRWVAESLNFGRFAAQLRAWAEADSRGGTRGGNG